MAFSADQLIPLVDEGLGNSSYLLDLGDGSALAVDASRDLRALNAAAQRRGLHVRFAADTHLHADFLSGAVQLHKEQGAQILASAHGDREFPHTGLGDLDEVDLGGLTLRALATPGHTDEHLSFVICDGGEEIGVFTGGSLIVKSAARTDLLGAQRTIEMTRRQFRSLQRLAALPDDAAVWPTHGAGSFCSAPAGAQRTSTIGAERDSNPLLSLAEDAFVDTLTRSLGSYPTYFRHLAERNRQGPTVVDGEPSLDALSPDSVRRLTADGAWIIDARPAAAFGAGHVPGAVSIPLRAQFASWLGWVVPDDVPLVFVVPENPVVLSELVWQAYKIGYERIVGYLAGGMAAWVSTGNQIALTPYVPADETAASMKYVDVRQAAEWNDAHVPGARHIEVGDIATRADAVPTGALVACGHGERAMTAASLLQRHGRRDVAVLDGGPDDFARCHRIPLVTGR